MFTRKKLVRTLSLAAALLMVFAITFVVASPRAQAHATSSTQSIGTPKSIVIHDTSGGGGGNRIPNWHSSFTYNSVTYPFTMVGTNPANGSATTTIATEIFPVSFTFSNGVTLDGRKKVAPTIASPIFQPANFISGITQYGDAIQRAEFWNDVSTVSPDYHVLLAQPTVANALKLAVPASAGQEVTLTSGIKVGLINETWFFSNVIRQIVDRMHVSSLVLPIALTYNTFLYVGNPNNCCILGFHGSAGANTYIFAAYSDPGIFNVPIEDINGLSHEVAEWQNDPFTNARDINVVPNWQSPIAPQYGCNNLLEVGDPLVGVSFDVNGYHPQDEAFLPWFAKEVTSTSINGQFDYLGVFTGPAPSC